MVSWINIGEVCVCYNLSGQKSCVALSSPSSSATLFATAVYPRKSHVVNHCNLPASASDVETVRLASVSPSSFTFQLHLPWRRSHLLRSFQASPSAPLTTTRTTPFIPSYHPTSIIYPRAVNDPNIQTLPLQRTISHFQRAS